jgi:ribosome assembly protein YihI (activator of Der GTPase)
MDDFGSQRGRRRSRSRTASRSRSRSRITISKKKRTRSRSRSNARSRSRSRSNARSRSRSRHDAQAIPSRSGYTGKREIEVNNNPDITQLCDDVITDLKNKIKEMEEFKNELKKANFDDLDEDVIDRFRFGLPWSTDHRGDGMFDFDSIAILHEEFEAKMSDYHDF